MPAVVDPDEPTLKERILKHDVTQTAFAIYGWVQERIWPIYSIGMVVAAVSLVGAVYEKQMIADYAFGSQTSDAVHDAQQTAAQSLDDEAAHLVRAEVYGWNRAKFKQEALAADI
jgi:hypothetical protein